MHKHRHVAKRIFPVCTAFHPHHHFHTQTPTRSWFLIGWAIRNTITDFCMQKREKVNSTKYAFLKQITFFFQAKLLGRHTPNWTCIFKSACMHTPLLKADLRQYFSFNNANKHLYCFVWWMAWFMRKTSHQQYFSCRIPGDSERADWGRGEGDTAAWYLRQTSCTRCALWW